MGFYVVLGDTLAAAVLDPEVALCGGVTLSGGEPIPSHGLGVVLRDACAIVVHSWRPWLAVMAAAFGVVPHDQASRDLILRVTSRTRCPTVPALAIGHKQDETFVVDCIREVRPPFSSECLVRLKLGPQPCNERRFEIGTLLS